MASPDAPLRLENVVVRFGPTTALNGVSLALERGETVVILGAAGSGKTVLLKTALALMHPNAGSVFLFGQETGKLKETQLFELRSRMGILFQRTCVEAYKKFSGTITRSFGFNQR